MTNTDHDRLAELCARRTAIQRNIDIQRRHLRTAMEEVAQIEALLAREVAALAAAEADVQGVVAVLRADRPATGGEPPTHRVGG